MKSALEKLNASAMKIGEEVYAAQQAEQAQGNTEAPAGDAPAADDDVIDAEIVDEDDTK